MLHATSLVVGRASLVANGARRGVVVDVFEVLGIGQVVEVVHIRSRAEDGFDGDVLVDGLVFEFRLEVCVEIDVLA